MKKASPGEPGDAPRIAASGRGGEMFFDDRVRLT